MRPLRRAFAAAHPGVTVRVQEDVTERLVRALEDGELDLAIVSTCRSAAGVHRELWQREPLLMVVPQEHPAVTQGRVGAQVLREEPFLALEESHCLSQQIGRWCHQQGIRRQTTLTAVQLATIVAMVAAGQGVSLLPAMSCPTRPGEAAPFCPYPGQPPAARSTVCATPRVSRAGRRRRSRSWPGASSPRPSPPRGPGRRRRGGGHLRAGGGRGRQPDGHQGPGGLAIVGVNATLANAVFHATGRRVRQLRVRTEGLL